MCHQRGLGHMPPGVPVLSSVPPIPPLPDYPMVKSRTGVTMRHNMLLEDWCRIDGYAGIDTAAE
jgi:hypothetical protein